MDKILFIVPPNIDFESYAHPNFNERVVTKQSGNYGSIITEMPLGLLSLSAFLKKNIEIEIKLIDFNIILNKIDSFEYTSFSDLFHATLSTNGGDNYIPTIIGISTLFMPAYYNMLYVARSARKIFPNALIIAGGGIPTNMYTEIFRDSDDFDALCCGEGEKPLLGLIEACDKKNFLSAHHSWITREKVEEKQLFHHDFINDLDEIPFLDYGILDADDYRSNTLLSLFPLAQKNMTAMPTIASRGCPYLCCFCSSHTVHGRSVRYHSVHRIKEDFKRLRDHHGAEIIVFFDDHFMADRQRVFEIIDIMRELRLTAFFPSSLALCALDRKVLEALKIIGVDHLILSVESGSDRVLKEIMHKPLDKSITERVINDCRELGIASDVSILIGLPGETKKDIEDARSFLKTLSVTWFRISMATPLVGSEMFNECVKHNYLKGDYLSCDYKRAVIETEEFSKEYIQEKAYSLNLELNFVENSDFKLGNYVTALKEFENTIRVKSDHAFAYYFAARCCKMMHSDERYLTYKRKYQEIIESSTFWKNYADKFGLTPLD